MKSEDNLDHYNKTSPVVPVPSQPNPLANHTARHNKPEKFGTTLVRSLLAADLQVTRELVVRGLTGLDDLPQVGAQELVGLGDGGQGSLQEVSLSRSGSGGLGVTVLDSGHLEESLRSGGGDDVGSSGYGEQGESD
jgi:hypothetical protein